MVTPVIRAMASRRQQRPQVVIKGVKCPRQGFAHMAIHIGQYPVQALQVAGHGAQAIGHDLVHGADACPHFIRRDQVDESCRRCLPAACVRCLVMPSCFRGPAAQLSPEISPGQPRRKNGGRLFQLFSRGCLEPLNARFPGRISLNFLHARFIGRSGG